MDIPVAILPDASESPLPDAIGRQAVHWLVLLQGEHVTQEMREAWQAWRTEKPEHERAWQRVETFLAGLRTLPSSAAHDVLAAERVPDKGRRRAAKLMAIMAAAGGAWLAVERVPAREWLADYRTGTGERRTVVLDDGTRLVLNARSAVDVKFDAGRRLVTLLEGEILIETAPDAQTVARPFYVQTAQGCLQALGTRFTVRQRQADVQVEVFEGAVRVRPAKARDQDYVVQAGQQTRFSQDGAEMPLADVDEQSAAWASGMLVAREMRLDDFLDALAPYRNGSLGCDPAIAALRVSGIYPLADTDRVLDMLQRTLPVEIHALTRYWVRLKPRDALEQKG
ncbi:FecR domain-containing protein [Oxalicibacterium solurbis]|uniref:Anti-sigma factor FoxR n=1 Tax=Oxalicibacterium solurbis TaxID=69280 RepID=A0A8J3F4K7_9BURK|nr:FecR family protein [Oxalicibacterium solurbis]GGI54617.1 anti-sigma factor FoxR [Oxalicibacterium solurbis]